MAEPEHCARGEVPRGAPSSCRCGGRGPHPAKRGLFLPPPEGVPYGLVLARLLWATSLTACTPADPGHVCANPSSAHWPRTRLFCGREDARSMPDDAVVLRPKQIRAIPQRLLCNAPTQPHHQARLRPIPKLQSPGTAQHDNLSKPASQPACQLRWHGSAVSIWRLPSSARRRTPGPFNAVRTRTPLLCPESGRTMPTDRTGARAHRPRHF